MEALLVALGGALSILGGVAAAYIQGKLNAQVEGRKRREVMQDAQANWVVELSQVSHKFIETLAEVSHVAGWARNGHELVGSDAFSRYVQAESDYSRVLGGIHLRLPDSTLFEAALAVREDKGRITESLGKVVYTIQSGKSGEFDPGKLVSDLQYEHKKKVNAFEEVARNHLFGTSDPDKSRLASRSSRGRASGSW